MFVVIGPPGSGKTTLLAVLLGKSWGANVTVEPRCEESVKLCRIQRKSLLKGALLDATSCVSVYRAALNGVAFEVWDAPGGSVFGAHGTQSHVFASLGNAEGFMLCVDIANETDVVAALIDVPTLLERLPTKRWSRIVVCATKCDVLYGAAVWKDRSLAGRLRESEPEFAPEQRALANYIRQLRNRAGKSRAMWTSAYGFAKCDGAPNFDPDTGGLRVRGGDGENCELGVLLSNWEPLNVVESFRYLVLGDQS